MYSLNTLQVKGKMAVMKPELHLFILWERARKYEKMILKDLHENFDVLQTLEIVWDRRCFSNNISKFYGKKLPPKCEKEKEVGTGPFLLVLLWDEHPLYVLRRVNSGDNLVDVNVFDTKEMYRSIFGGHSVHSSNTKEETAHDLEMLIGIDIKSVIEMLQNKKKITTFKRVL